MRIFQKISTITCAVVMSLTTLAVSVSAVNYRYDEDTYVGNKKANAYGFLNNVRHAYVSTSLYSPDGSAVATMSYVYLDSKGKTTVVPITGTGYSGVTVDYALPSGCTFSIANTTHSAYGSNIYGGSLYK